MSAAGAIGKLLIANRGEIAVRIIRACRETGVVPVAIYSEADRDALHVREAAEAWPVGPAAAAQSYLSAERVVDAALRSGAQAIHPGYGFLSESAAFSQRVRDAGLRFVGPAPEAMRRLGSKTAARSLAERTGVPFVPGTVDPVSSDAEAAAAAERIGFPVMVKASSGGGGKGMRRVERPEDLAAALRAARSEARSSFGDDAVYIERALVRPRHVEIQVLADAFGNAVWLGERECSIQRRHQKVVEETPSAVITPEMRRAMGESAVALCRAAGYSGAGTVEFLVDADGDFHFLEVNARLQVEHPVTEMVTGIDLVREQLRIAEGEPLRLLQDDIHPRGHAIECRIYAEDPARGFLPSPGRIRRLRLPQGPWVRNDEGVYEGCEVGVHYDPLIGKLIVWGADREQAVARMRRALREYEVHGIATTIEFHRRLLATEEFRSGRVDTGFVDELLLRDAAEPGPELASTALVAAAIHRSIAGEEARGRAGGRDGSCPDRGGWKAAARAAGLRGDRP